MLLFSDLRKISRAIRCFPIEPKAVFFHQKSNRIQVDSWTKSRFESIRFKICSSLIRALTTHHDELFCGLWQPQPYQKSDYCSKKRSTEIKINIYVKIHTSTRYVYVQLFPESGTPTVFVFFFERNKTTGSTRSIDGLWILRILGSMSSVDGPNTTSTWEYKQYWMPKYSENLEKEQYWRHKYRENWEYEQHISSSTSSTRSTKNLKNVEYSEYSEY